MKLLKLRINKNFNPLPLAEEDEVFRNGIFEFNVTKLLAFISDNPTQFPVEQVEVARLVTGVSGRLNEEPVGTAIIEKPIVLAEISPNRFNVIDGNHRLEKAHREGMERIPAYRVRVDQHMTFLTSAKAYETYAEYWNSKIKDSGSSPISVGKFWLREFPKLVKQGDFHGGEGPESVGFSECDFCLVVEPLNDPAGKELLSPEPVEDERAMLS